MRVPNRPPRADPWAAYAIVGASLGYYASLRAPVFLLVMVLRTVALWLLVRVAGKWLLPASVAVFVVGWIFQFIGHRLEGRKPSFFEDVQYLWVGPLFVVALGLRRMGVRG